MKFLVTDTTGYVWEDKDTWEVIEIATLEELLAYISQHEFSAILHQPEEDKSWVIEFYTSYRE